jgi:hypothetical protein
VRKGYEVPIVNGRMYPELNIYPIDNTCLRILILDIKEPVLATFIDKLNTLRSYIADKYDEKYKFDVIINDSGYDEETQKLHGFRTVTIEANDKEMITDFALKNDVDVIYGSNEKLILSLYQGQKPFELTFVFEELSLEIESFLTGKDIAWSFHDAVWNATWLSKYNESDAIMQSVMKLLNKFQTDNPQKQKYIDFARALTNKAGHIRHCEEILTSLVQKKNYSERNHSIKNSYGYEDSYDYSFEITYHLGNYYFLMSGCIDIIGRLLQKMYRLGDEKNIERVEFIEKLEAKNKELADIFSNKTMNDWIIWLKKRRNYVAHESNTTYSDVLKSKKEKTPDSDISKIVEGLKDWKNLELLVGRARVGYLKEDAKFVVRMYEDSTILTKDAMSIPWFNQETQEHETRLFHPLINIRADYDRINSLLRDTVNLLTK